MRAIAIPTCCFGMVLASGCALRPLVQDGAHLADPAPDPETATETATATGAVTTPAPAIEALTLTDDYGVHNLMVVSDGVYSGALPEGEAGFDALRALGVRTIISVDAARPDVESAEARGMRYAHVPVEYAGISRDEQMNLARAMRDLERPIYVHCHHGKHRGPAAAVVGLELIGEISPETALAAMTNAGTSKNYPGLWACAREATPVPVSELEAWDADLPAVARVGDFVSAMAGLDRAFDRLALVRDAGWAVPSDHPDLVPVSLAGQAADLLRVSADHPVEVDDPAAFVAAMRASAGHASDLERALDAGDLDGAERSWSALAASCKECHATHRNAKDAW